jgi:nicotinamidase-related amidase
MSDPRQILRAGDALIVIDVQIDFCPSGALPIERGDEVVPVLSRWIAAAAEAQIPICASRDWHPLHHLSFVESGGEWHRPLRTGPPWCSIPSGFEASSLRPRGHQGSSIRSRSVFSVRRDRTGDGNFGSTVYDACGLAVWRRMSAFVP